MLASWDSLRQTFADQFEANGDGFLYRKFSRGAPIQVSAAEHDRYIASFNKFLKYAMWGIAAGTVIVIFALVFYEFQSNVELPEYFIWIAVGGLLTIFMAVYFSAWNAPARELRGRGSLGAPRSGAEMRQRAFEKMTYGQLAGFVAIEIAVIFKISRGQNLLQGWSRLWLVFGVLVFALALFQAFRKWRFDSRQKSRS